MKVVGKLVYEGVTYDIVQNTRWPHEHMWTAIVRKKATGSGRKL